MAEIKYTVRGLVEAERFLQEFSRGAQSFAGTTVAVGTPLPRGLFVDVGTRRGVRATHWLSGLVGQAAAMAKRILADKMTTPLELAEALVQVGNELRPQAAGRAPVGATRQLRGSVTVSARRGGVQGFGRLGGRR